MAIQCPGRVAKFRSRGDSFRPKVMVSPLSFNIWLGTWHYFIVFASKPWHYAPIVLDDYPAPPQLLHTRRLADYLLETGSSKEPSADC